MNSALIGTWDLESGENINDYLKQLGMALNKRKVAITIMPSIIISHTEDHWCIAIDMKNKGTETLFNEGSEIDTSNELKFVFDARFYFEARRMCRSTFKFETPNRLIQHMKFTDTEEQQTIIREVNEEGKLVEDLEMNGVKAKRIFKRRI